MSERTFSIVKPDAVAKNAVGGVLKIIEDGHIDAVQAELDYLNSTGYWFDWKEFDME